MINAKSLNAFTKESLPYEAVVNCKEFQMVMKDLESDMMKAAKKGKAGIEVIVYCLNAILGVHNIFFAHIGNVKYVDLTGEFLWPYVRSELEKNGYTISQTLTRDHYFISWN